MNGGRNSRNEGLFGAKGQARIAATHVAIVGLGGLGSHVAQQLAYLGTMRFTVVDFDRVEESNLNRLIGATPDDAAIKSKKVEVAHRTIRSIQPEAEVVPVDRPFMDATALEALSAADVVFGCLDHDAHRLDLNERTSEVKQPYFDLATDTGGEDNEHYGGRVILCDGTQCLVCLPEILDQRAVAEARLSPDLLRAHDEIYGIDRNALTTTGPSVVSVNGVVASLAVTEYMSFITGLREPQKHLIYRGESGIVRRSVDPPSAGCYYCTGLRSVHGNLTRNS